MAMICFLGRGVAADPAEAYKWAMPASAGGETDAMNTRREIAAKKSAEAVAEGKQRAIRPTAPAADPRAAISPVPTGGKS